MKKLIHNQSSRNRNLKILYNRGLTYCNYLSFLHITTGGKFLYPLTCYADYEEILKQIINDYKLDIKKMNDLSLSTVDTSQFPLVKILDLLPQKNSLFETILVSINDNFALSEIS